MIIIKNKMQNVSVYSDLDTRQIVWSVQDDHNIAKTHEFRFSANSGIVKDYNQAIFGNLQYDWVPSFETPYTDQYLRTVRVENKFQSALYYAMQ